MGDAKLTKPDVVLALTEDQIADLALLLEKRKSGGGLIIGSVGLSGKTVALKYVERETGIEIYNLAYQKIGKAEETSNVSS